MRTQVPPDYATSVCNLFAQLGARGSSVLFPSGDSGYDSLYVDLHRHADPHISKESVPEAARQTMVRIKYNSCQVSLLPVSNFHYQEEIHFNPVNAQVHL